MYKSVKTQFTGQRRDFVFGIVFLKSRPKDNDVISD